MATAEQIQTIKDSLKNIDLVLDDTELGNLIDQSLTLHDAAIAAAESAAAFYATSVNLQVGSIKIDNKSISESWRAIKTNLIVRQKTGSGVIVDPADPDPSTTSPWAGFGAVVTGSSVTRVNTVANNPDLVQPQAQVGQFDNPPTNPAGSGDGDTSGVVI